MKRWTLSIIIITLILNINGFTANGSGHNDTNNQEGTLNEINSTNVESDFYKNNQEENKKLSFNELINLDKPSIEDAKDFNLSLKNGSVIMFSKDNSREHEIYNISNLDKFIDSFNSGEEAYVRVIKGSLKLDGTFILNKLDEYETDGKYIKTTSYDVSSDKNELIGGKPIYAAKITKTVLDDGIRYSICGSKDTPDDMGATVISFGNDDVKN